MTDSTEIPRVSHKPAPEMAIRTKFTQAVSDTGLTRAEIARRAGLGKTTVCDALSGRRTVSLLTWDTILQACNIEIGYRLK